jgi:hypothetical protein
MPESDLLIARQRNDAKGQEPKAAAVDARGAEWYDSSNLDAAELSLRSTFNG